MAKKIGYIVIILIVAIGLFSYFTPTYATTVDDTVKGAQGFLDIGKTQTQVDQGELKNISNLIFNLLLAFAIVSAVIVGMILGIQFMTSGIEEKAQIKEKLLPYAISCFVIFGAFGIWKIAVTVLSSW